LCGSTRFLVIDHRDGNESNGDPDNLRWLCKRCNTRLGLSMARAGIGRRTRQFNPGARNLAEYTEAVLQHARGEHDHGGKIIHETPKERRREFAGQIWRMRRARGTDRRYGEREDARTEKIDQIGKNRSDRDRFAPPRPIKP